MRASALHRATPVLAVLAFFLLGNAAAAQEKDPEPVRELTLQQSRDLLQARNRNLMHPGDPLTIVGVDQGDNDMRKRTPALANSNKVVTQVDQSEAYDRALAMYANGATFKTPIAPVVDESEPHKHHSPRPAAPASEPQKSARQWPWLVALAISIAFMVWLGKHFAEPAPARRAR